MSQASGGVLLNGSDDGQFTKQPEMLVIAYTRRRQFAVIAVRRTFETTSVVGKRRAAVDIRRIALTYLFGRAFWVAIDTGRLSTVAVSVQRPYPGTETLRRDARKDTLAVQATEARFTRIARVLKRTRAKITARIELASVFTHSSLTSFGGPETRTLTRVRGRRWNTAVLTQVAQTRTSRPWKGTATDTRVHERAVILAFEVIGIFVFAKGAVKRRVTIAHGIGRIAHRASSRTF